MFNELVFIPMDFSAAGQFIVFFQKTWIGRQPVAARDATPHSTVFL
jgi:hypothetical protein